MLKGHSDHIWSVEWSPDGKQIVPGSFDNSIFLWSMKSSICFSKEKWHLMYRFESTSSLYAQMALI